MQNRWISIKNIKFSRGETRTLFGSLWGILACVTAILITNDYIVLSIGRMSRWANYREYPGPAAVEHCTSMIQWLAWTPVAFWLFLIGLLLGVIMIVISSYRQERVK